MIKEKAIEALKIEADAVERLTERIDDEFEKAVQAILDCSARVVVTGMGKSGHIGRKMAATFASTGTPSFFMHPGEAFHGDLGMVTEHDVVIAISHSGESSEIVNILPVIRRIGAVIVAMCGRRDSSLGKNCDYFVDISVEREACPLGLAPTEVRRRRWRWGMPWQWRSWRQGISPRRILRCSTRAARLEESCC